VIYTLVYDEAPPSNNAGGGGTKQNKFHANRLKQQWQGVYALLLLKERVPKHLRHVIVSVELQFTRPNTRRDPHNYYQSVIKALADAMTKGGWLDDDTEEFFEALPIRISKEKLTGVGPLVKSRMVITLDVSP
jgi:Holliday junction resolvase RusA-like endonuclease